MDIYNGDLLGFVWGIYYQKSKKLVVKQQETLSIKRIREHEQFVWEDRHFVWD